jgi:nicotinamidase-related amidase
MHPNLLDPSASVFFVSDMKEAFRSKMPGFDEVARRIATVISAMRLLQIPILVTEQYPKGLGQTVAEIKAALPADLQPIEKTAFSACGAGAFCDALEKLKARQVIVCGIEAHVCVSQTVHDLLNRGHQVHLLTDCILSRGPENRQIGISKMQLAGAILTSTEIVLFELMRDAKHPQFKAVQQLIK